MVRTSQFLHSLVTYFSKRNIRKKLLPEELICSKNVRARASLRPASLTSATELGSTIPDGMLSESQVWSILDRIPLTLSVVQRGVA